MSASSIARGTPYGRCGRTREIVPAASPGATALGADRSVSMERWQRHDLELMLLAAREQDVPMIIGSAGDCGSNSRVDMFVRFIKEIAAEHDLPPFKLAYFYSEVDTAYLRELHEDGVTIEGLDDRTALTIEDIDATTRAVTARIIADGRVWMSGSRWQDRDILRISVSNWSTDDDDTAVAVDAVRDALTAVRSS